MAGTRAAKTNGAKSNPPQPPQVSQKEQEQQQIIGFAISVDCRDEIVGILKELSYETVYKVMPQLVGAQPLTNDNVVQPDS